MMNDGCTLYNSDVQPYCEQGPDNLSDCLRGPDVLNFKTCSLLHYNNKGNYRKCCRPCQHM